MTISTRSGSRDFWWDNWSCVTRLGGRGLLAFAHCWSGIREIGNYFVRILATSGPPSAFVMA
jgi:hypothetical protein